MPAATVSAIGLGPGKLTPAARATARLDTCNWVGTGSNWMKTLIVSVNPRSGLETTYNNRAIFTEFVELQVAGHPAVRANQTDALAGCNLYVGLSDAQTLWVIGNSGTNGTMDQHCAISTQTAEAIIKALP
ncbi:hypothetical protein GCM10007977_060150 [Dactylosporangium sucinum]|uniref:Uncharacterized protein n=1 Tax=Dactylosporangium sucinum TaxID=1424081 RepID=A0A917U0X1_9ACTN|nr:hypothetical protein GCM10007977_060150 [Dactylosporangium sucinum]